MDFKLNNVLDMDFEVTQNPKTLTVTTETGTVTTASMYGEGAAAMAYSMLRTAKKLSPIAYKEEIWSWFNKPLKTRLKLLQEVEKHNKLMNEG